MPLRRRNGVNLRRHAERRTRPMPSTPRRILLIAPFLEIGGADKFNLDLVRLLTARGHAISIVTTFPSADPWREHFQALTPDIAALHPHVRPADAPAFVLKRIRAHRADTVLVTTSEVGYLLLPYLRANTSGVTFLDYMHMEEEYWQGGGYPAMSLREARVLDFSVVSSQHLRGWLLARGGDASRVAVCTTNIDATEWDPARFERDALRRELGLAAGEPTILYAARLAPQKRPRLMAEVLARLAARGLRFTCLVAGDGPERAWLEAFARRRAPSLRLLGAVSGARIRELMAAADIFFLPSQQEGISLALYEAMAMGLAPVCADVGGQRELLTPACGVLVPPGPDEARGYVEALATLVTDPAGRRAMGLAGRRRVAEGFRLDQMGERMAELVECAHELARAAPRPTPTAAEAEASAALAVERVRQDRLARRLWGKDQEPAGGPAGPVRRAAIRGLRLFRRAVEPLYLGALARSGSPLRQFVQRARGLLIRWLYRGES
jgi:glycosyltransferase involved in cell wall biosynthesis